MNSGWVPRGDPRFEEDSRSFSIKPFPSRTTALGFRQTLHPAVETYRSAALSPGRDAATTLMSVSHSELPPVVRPEEADDGPEEMIL
jgi:hypothetical protein